MRLGFFIGFLIGAAIATLVSLSEQEESGSGAADGSPLDQVKRKAREVRQAAREEAAAKEAEMIREWDEARHRGS